MSESNEACVVAFDVLGVGAVVTAESPDVAERVRENLPQGALERDPQPGDAEFAIDVPDADAADAAIVHLRNELLAHVALHAPDHVFVRAGVVAIGGRAIVLPGDPGVGKSTLVAALIRAGATYYADGYVPIDSAGIVHPYAQAPPPIAEHGGEAGTGPVVVAVIALVEHREGSQISLAERPQRQAVEILLDHVEAKDSRLDVAERMAHAAAQHAVFLEGERDGADGAAAALLGALIIGPQAKQKEPPPGIRFVTLVFELESQLVELAGKLDAAGIEAVLLNGGEVRPALANAFADSFSAIVSVPRSQVPRALGIMESEGWTQTTDKRGSRHFKRGVVVRIRARPRGRRLARALGLGTGPVAKGQLGFQEPEANLTAADPTETRRPAPLDPGGPMRTGLLGTVMQLASEGLTVLDTLRLRTRERDFKGQPVQHGPGVFGFEVVTERHLESILAELPGDGTGARVVEVGTATGAVAFSVARERPRAEVLATDVSLRALGWARRNRRRLGVGHVRLAQGSLLAPVPAEWRGHVTVVAANLPLAPPARGVELAGTSGWPPGTATGPGADGLGLVRALGRDARGVLAPGGYLILQLQGPQGRLIGPYLEELGYEHNIPSGSAQQRTVEVAARWPGYPPEAPGDQR